MAGQPNDDPITHWIDRLKAGDEAAAAELWKHCFERLVRFARQRLRGSPRRLADEEDLALSVLKSFCVGAPEGRFRQLENRKDLWALLLRMTRRKAVDHWRHEHRDRRGGGEVRGESVFDEEQSPRGLDGMPGADSLPQMFALLDELLEDLRDDTLRTIVVLQLQGYPTGEIAHMLGTNPRTIQRKLRLIKERWHDREADA